MLLIDFDQCRFIPDEEIKQAISRQRPYRQWLKKTSHRQCFAAALQPRYEEPSCCSGCTG